MGIATTFGKITGRAQRRALIWNARTRQSLLRWQFTANPQMPASDKMVVDGLSRTGVHVTSLAEMGFEGTEQLIADAAALRAELSQLDPDMSHVDAQPFMVLADPIELARCRPEVLLFGLQDRVLDIIEAYMQQRTHCLGVFVRRDLADGASSGTRTSHLDRKDITYVKMIVYMSDVDAQCGPFEYVPEGGGPAQEHRAITGPAGTVIFVDTARLFHRGKVPSQERFALFYSYATRSPSNPEGCAKGHFIPALAHLDVPLPDRQRESLPWHITPKG